MTVTYPQLEYTQFFTYDFAFIIQVTPNKHFEYTQGAPSRRRVTGVVRLLPRRADGPRPGSRALRFQHFKSACISQYICAAMTQSAHQPFGSLLSSWEDVQLEPFNDLAAAMFSRSSQEDEDDASSVATDEDRSPVEQVAFPAKEFYSFEDLRCAVSAFSRLAHGQIADNSRCAKKDALPTQWLRSMFPETRGSVKYSGFFYCTCNPGSDCEFKVPYRLLQNSCWAVLSSAVWSHSHEISMLAINEPSVSGLVHLKSVNQLSVEHKQAIISFLEAGLSCKVIRFKFRAKYPGYELRARCCKTVKEGYLKERYGADRDQMSKFMQQLHHDCNPAAGGVCDIIYAENMELGELYFQMPLLRKVGEYFGKFSVIDTSHNMSMYERQMATYNVKILHLRVFLSILKVCCRL